MIIALVGNQNCGKTTLFNQLTGANQHVGNFPGVTVDQKIGEVRSKKNCQVVDLPGVYSIRPYSNEEIITRDFILNERPDAILNIVDATNIERNLYLSLQLLEMHIPMVIALNMMDEVKNNGGSINIEEMSKKIGVPVLPISAIKNEGIDELINKIIEVAEKNQYPKVMDFCKTGPVHRCIHSMSHLIEDHAQNINMSPRFAAMKVAEKDTEIINKLQIDKNEIEIVNHLLKEMEQETGMDFWAIFAGMRYDFIEDICKETVKKCEESKEYKRSVKIDNILTNKYLAIPIFIGIMFLVFFLTFNVIGELLSNFLEIGIAGLTNIVDTWLSNYGVNTVIHSLIIDGIFAGVGSVLSFLPIVVTLFFFLSILEDTGYMARIAFIMDKLLRKIGLSGKSIVPMLIGFGCSVPAAMATRTLSSDRDRKMTILLTPFMSCSAKIPIYAVFSAAFFPRYSALVMIGLYVTGIIIGVIIASILNKTRFKGNPIPFVMELPNYRFPSMKSVCLLMWDKAKDFIERAFTIIFAATIIIWFLQTFDTKLNIVNNSSESLLAMIGKIIAPIFKPLGFGNWKIATALITGFTAKETVVSTLGVLTGTNIENLNMALGGLFTSLSAISFLVFTLLYTPCVAAVAAIKKELKSGTKTLAIVIMQCGVAWGASFIVYQIGSIIIQ